MKYHFQLDTSPKGGLTPATVYCELPCGQKVWSHKLFMQIELEAFSDLEARGNALKASTLNIATAFIRPFPSMTVFSVSILLMEYSGNHPFFLTRFLTGPLNLNDPEAKFRFPKIFVSAEDGYEELHLIVYKV